MLRDASAGVYKRLILKDNRIIGTVLFGEVADGAWFNDLKKKSANISEMRDTLIFGPAFQGGGAARSRGRRRGACRTTPRSAAATASARARSPARSRRRD